MRSRPGQTSASDFPRVPRRAVQALFAAMLALGPLHLAAQFTYSEDFKNNTADGWNFYTGNTSPGPYLTSGVSDAVGDGWLRLASPTTNQANAVYFDTPIPSAGNRVSISFSANMYGGNGFSGTGADGLVFFLYDASQAFNPGAFGGSLGYAQKDGINGLGGGYLGVALDVFGNFSNPTEGRDNGVGFAPNAVVVRGPGSGQDGYLYLGGTTGSNNVIGYDYTDSGDPTAYDAGSDSVIGKLPYQLGSPTATERPNQSTQYRKVEVVLDENSQLVVRMQFGEDGLWYDVLNLDVSSFVRPEQLRIGFSSGTGDGTMTYEVGGMLRIDATAGTGNFMWDNDEGPSSQIWGTSATNPLNWFGNTNPILKSNIIFNSAYIGQAQNIDLRGSDKVVKNIYFSGPNAYSLFTTESRKLIFDSDTVGGLTTISLTNDAAGNAAHTIGVDILMNKQLDVNNNITPAFTINGGIDTNGNALALKGTGTTVINGVISGAGTVSKSDSGHATLAGANTYTGATTVTGGTLTVSAATALGSTAAGTTVSSGGTLALAGAGTTFAAEALTLNGAGFAGQGALHNAAGDNILPGTVSLASDTAIGTAAGTTLTLNGVVSGTSAANDLVKTGAGTLVLAAANTYQGTTTVSAGTLQIANENNLGANPGAFNAAQLAIDGGTLRSSGSAVTIDDSNRGVTIGSGGGTLDTVSNLTIANVVAGSGALVKTGSGSLTLSGANTHSGSVSINAGTLYASGGGAIGNSSAVTVASGGTFDIGAANETIGSLAGAGSVALGTRTLSLGGDNTSTTYSGVASGSGGLTKTGSGTLTLTGANSYTGTTSLNGGTLQIGAAGVFADSSALTLNGGTLALGGNFNETLGALTLAGNSTIDFNNATSTLTFASATRSGGTLTIDDWAGAAYGGGNSRLVFTSPTLTGFSTGSNNELTQINFSGWGSGAVRLPSGEIVPYTGGTVYTYVPTGGSTWGTDANWLDGAGSDVVIDPGTFPQTAGDTAILGSSITGPATVNLGSARTLGYLIVNNANTYTLSSSALTFDVTAGGRAQLVNQGAGGLVFGGDITLNDGLTITQAGSGAINLSGNNISGTGNLIVGGDGSGLVTINGAINTGATTLVKNGESTLRLTGASNFTGAVSVNGGVVAIRSLNNLGAGSATLTLSGGTLRTEVNNVSFSSGNRAFAIGSGGGTFDTVTNLSVGTVVSGSGDITKTGSGTLTFSGANTHTGNIAVNAGTFAVSGGSAVGNSSAVTLASGTTFTVNASETIGSLDGAGAVGLAAGTLSTGGNNSTTALSGVVSGGGALTKQGTGTMTLSGANTYSGATTVSAGTLVAANNTALGTTAAGTTVSSGATLALSDGITVGAEALTLSGTGAGSNGALRNLSGNNAHSGGITLNADTEIQSDAGTLTLSGNINGNAAGRDLAVDGAGNVTLTGILGTNVGADSTNSLVKTGAGTLTLSGNNTYVGTTVVNAGTVVITHGNALGNTGTGDTTTVAGGATLALSGGISTAERLTLNGQGVGSQGALQNLSGNNTVSGTVALAGESYVGVASGTTLTASGVVSGTGFGLTKIGDGTLVLTGANTYTGTTAVTTGTLEVRSNAGLGTNAAPTTVASGATLAFNSASGNVTTNENITLAGSGVGGLGGLQSTGASGTTTLSGTVTLNADSTIGTAAGTTLRQTGTLTEEAGADYNLVKTGAGTLELAGTANSYNGTTTVRAGTLVVGASAPVSANGALGNSSSVVQLGDAGTGANSVSLLAGGTTGGVIIDRAIAVNNYGTGTTLGGTNTSGLNVFNGAITLNKDVTLTAATGGTVDFNGVIGGNGAVTKTGSGTVILAADNTYTGATTISAGQLVAAHNNALGTTGAGTSVASGATLGLQGGVSIAENITLSGTGYSAGGALRNISGNNTVSGSITLGAAATIANTADNLSIAGSISGSHALTVNTASGAVTSLIGNQSYTGATTFSGSGLAVLTGTLATSSVQLDSGSTLRLGASDRINNSANLVLNGGTFALNGYSEGSAGSAGLATLNLAASSTLDFTGDAGSLRFVSDARTGGTLTIMGWSGNVFEGGGDHQLLIDTATTNIGVGNITFDGWGTARVLDRGGGLYEILPTVDLATVYRWDGSSSTAWNTGFNWTKGDGSAGTNGQPNTAGMTVIFGDLGQSRLTASLGGNENHTFGRLYFENNDATANNYTLTGTNNNTRITLDGTGTSTAEIVVSDNVAPTIDLDIIAADNVRITNNSTGTLSLSNTSGRNSFSMAGYDLTVTGSGRTEIDKTISGTGTDLLKSGSGTLVLSAANSYTGTTTLRQGTIELTGNAPSGSSGNLGNSSSAVVINDSTTPVSGDTALLMTDSDGGSTVGRLITVDNFGATTTLGGTNTSGTNTFSGAITLNKSVDLAAASGGTVAFTGVLSGAGGIEKVGDGAVILGGDAANTFTGNVDVSAGTLVLGITGGADRAIANSVAVTVASGATLSFDNGADTDSLDETLGSLAGAGTVTNTDASAVTLTTGANNATTTFSGTITNSGGALSLVKTGVGTMTLSGNNSYTGATTVNQGTLVAASNTALGTTAAGTTVTPAGTLGFRNNITITGESVTVATNTTTPAINALYNVADTNVLAGNVILSAGADNQAVRLGAAAGSQLTISGNISETFVSTAGDRTVNLVKTDAGTIVLSGANTYTGATNIAAGTLVAGSNAALGTTDAGTTVQAGATLGFQGGANIGSEALSLAGAVTPSAPSIKNLSGNNTSSGAITLSGAVNTHVEIDVAAASTLTLNGAITQAANSNGVTKTGGGTLNLGGGGPNTFTGGFAINGGTVVAQKTAGVTATGAGDVIIGDNTGISAGDGLSATLRLGANSQIADTSHVIIRQDGALDLQSYNETTGAVTMTGGAVTGTGTLTLGGNLTFSGVGTATAAISSNVALGATNRIVQIGNNGINGDSDTNISGVISGSGQTLRKTDLGTLELSGTSSNTFNGGLQVDDGVVLLNKTAGLNAIGGGSVTLGDGILGAGTATLRYGANNQLPNSTDIVFRTDGRLDMNGRADTVDQIDSAIAGAGQIIIGTGQLIVGSNNGNSIYSGTLSGTTGGVLEKVGTGSLTLSDADALRADRVMDFGGELKLEGGTLALDNITLNVATLRLTGDSVIDFGGSSTLNVGTLIVELASGETTTITSWNEFVDYFYAGSFSDTEGGADIPFDTRGQAPQNRIVFADWTGNNTWWQSWDNQVTPVPEPASYGALAVGGLVAFSLTRRRRRAAV